jgi:UDP-N-acetylmuramate--alanine ligase
MKKIHFIGIGGIGMSALAQYFKDQGARVTGSDRDTSPVTELLEKNAITVVIGQKADNVPVDAEMVVYSDAVPENNPERLRAKNLKIPQLSYFGMLGKVSEGKTTIAVAGTHGKTTTTGMLTKILADGNVSPTAIIGSIVKDFDSNYLHGDSNVFVVEACEYRDHLLELSPKILVITNLEWDHTDWFPSLEALQKTFRKAITKVTSDGTIVTNPGNPTIGLLLTGVKAQIVDYTKEESPDLRVPGEFNRANARAAAAAARILAPTLSSDSISTSLSHFHGTWRRFEYKGKSSNGADVFDDYAHHPTAIRATLSALRAQTKGKIFVAFHPHLYSRTRDLMEEFANSFQDADEVAIAPIYAARETNDGTVSSEFLAGKVRAHGVKATAYATFDEIRGFLLKAKENDVIMTMGAGDIYKVADALVKK